MSVQPAKPASPIRLLYEQLPKVYVFQQIRFSQLGVIMPKIHAIEKE